MKKLVFSCLWIAIIMTALFLPACDSQAPSQPDPKIGGGEANPELFTNKEAIEKWKDMRFGMFVHWGPVALKGTEIGWSRGREIPFSTYDSLYLEFNPVNFNAEEWISIAKEAGMKYFVITSKHHDGFTLFDSEFTDYDIMNTPIKRDLMKEMQLACENQGIMFGTYYSVLDWWHPDYPIGLTGNKEIRENADMAVYEKYLHNQVQELIEKYKTNILWFDGQWEYPWTHEMGMDLYKHCRDLKDNLLINNRVDKGFKGMAGMTDSLAKYAGDFGTPEQRIGGFNKEMPWESCITICQQWAWKPNDALKSTEECVNTLIKTIGGDGNLLLNVGPMPDGRIEPRQVEVLKEIGEWVTTNQQAIYGTRGGPYMPKDHVAATHKGKELFLFVMDGSRVVQLPAIPGLKVKKASLAGNASVRFSQRLNEWTFEVSEELPSEIAYVITVKMNEDLSQIEPIDW
jgi:alpha-L-fucosidase